MEDGFLKKKVQLHGRSYDAIVLPKIVRSNALRTFHDDTTAGHLGADKTHARIITKYCWPNVKEEVKAYVKSCKLCQSRKPLGGKRVGLLKPILVDGPFELVGMDFLGPFPVSNKGNTFVITAIDYFTKYAIIKAIPASNAGAVAEFFLKEIVYKHGAPKKILTDRGLPFLADLPESLFHGMGTQHVKTTAFKPSTNGLVERVQATLTTMISMYVDEEHSDWDNHLDALAFAYNTASQSTTRESPFYLIHGREAVHPGEAGINISPARFDGTHDYLVNLEAKLRNARIKVKRNLDEAARKTKERVDQHRQEKTYALHAQVLVHKPVREPGMATKLFHCYAGPYKILQVLNDLNYKVQEEGEDRVEIVHISKMKPYYTRTPGAPETVPANVESSTSPPTTN